jgi:hypothetical protein
MKGWILCVLGERGLEDGCGLLVLAVFKPPGGVCDRTIGSEDGCCEEQSHERGRNSCRSANPSEARLLSQKHLSIGLIPSG